MIKHDISLDGLSVCLGIPAGRDIPALTVKSIAGTYNLCHSLGILCDLAIIANNAVIQWARDEVINSFLATKATRLFLIDSDIIWEPEDFVRMLALSQKRDVVCATYPAKLDPTTFYILRDTEEALVSDEYGLFEILGAGLGFCVMTREVVEKLHEKAPKLYDEISGRDVAEIFRVGRTTEGKRQGEDMGFFEDIRNLGFTIYLDPAVNLGHVGQKIYNGSIMDSLNNLQPATPLEES